MQLLRGKPGSALRGAADARRRGHNAPALAARPRIAAECSQQPRRGVACRVASLETLTEPEHHQQLISADGEQQGEPQLPLASQVVVQDDLDQLLDVLPGDVGASLIAHPMRGSLIEVVLDLGRRPEARFQGAPVQLLRDAPVSRAELDAATTALGEFGSDNRAGIAGTLHRISALRSRKGAVVGLTCRVGRAVTGNVLIHDLLGANLPLLFLGRPGVGKTTVIREIARTLSDGLGKRVVIIDTSNEIAGDGDVPHAAIGSARRMQVPDAARQHQVMIEAVENHMPEVIIVDEISTTAEAEACRTIAERGVTLIGTAHGCFLDNLIKNPTLADLVGGVCSVTLGDEEARSRGTQKSVLERKGPPCFPVVVEMRDRGAWVAHDTAESVDALLVNKVPKVQLRLREGEEVTCLEVAYDQVEDQMLAQLSASAEPGEAEAAAAAAALRAAAEGSNAASMDELLAALRASTGSPGGSGSASPTGSFEGFDASHIEVSDWLARFKGLSEAEALHELASLRYLGSGSAGMLRPKAGSSFAFGRAAGGAAAAGGKKKRRATRANARARS